MSSKPCRQKLKDFYFQLEDCCKVSHADPLVQEICYGVEGIVRDAAHRVSSSDSRCMTLPIESATMTVGARHLFSSEILYSYVKNTNVTSGVAKFGLPIHFDFMLR